MILTYTMETALAAIAHHGDTAQRSCGAFVGGDGRWLLIDGGELRASTVNALVDRGLIGKTGQQSRANVWERPTDIYRLTDEGIRTAAAIRAAEFVVPRDTAPFYVNYTTANTSVKDGDFFRSQGGLRDDWGRSWLPIRAGSVAEARAIAIALRRRAFPHAHHTRHQDGSLEDGTIVPRPPTVPDGADRTGGVEVEDA